jgi:hypothetical protein
MEDGARNLSNPQDEPLVLQNPPSTDSAAPHLSDSVPQPELLRSLGRLVRGLSALFWGLPAALIVCVGIASAGWFRSFGVLPPLAATGLLLFGLWQIGDFQKQERPWRSALDRTRLVALINCGLCPFVFWWHRIPDHPFFTLAVAVLALSGLLFLFNLNLALARLGAMLPDETLRQETRQFTGVNRGLLVAMLLLVAISLLLARLPGLPPEVVAMIQLVNQTGFWSFVLLVLLPLSLTMAMIWKTKEVILASVFDARR